jgi:glycylpeptide N-tetradecanoyltransferase
MSKARTEDVIDTTTEDPEQPGAGDSNSEQEEDGQIEDGQAGASSPAEPSTSSKKKKKKKSKAMKALNALRGKHEIPQAVVDQVMNKVKSQGGAEAAGADEASVRAALEQMKIMEVAQGKAGIGGKNRKDMGEHKVRRICLVPRIQMNSLKSSGKHNLSRNWVRGSLA